MIKSYLINLDKDVERLSFFAANFNNLSMDFERISGIDGRLLPQQDYLDFLRLRPRHRKDWSRGQMGCFLSHYMIWKKIAEGDHEFCAVFEDDIHVSRDLKAILNSSDWIPGSVDIIRLETSTNRVQLTSHSVLEHANRFAYGVRSTSWCTGAYLISRKAAQTLISLPCHEHEPVDALLFNFSDSSVARKFVVLQFSPAPCTQDKHLAIGGGRFASNIESPVSSAQVIDAYVRRLSPTVVFRALYRSLIGYKRIRFK